MGIDDQTPLVLGSASPRRRELLAGLGLPLVVRPADVDESVQGRESPERYVERIVEAKRRAVLAQLEGVGFAASLVADTIVVVDDEVLGKPVDREDAVRLSRRIAGREHQVLTRYAITVRGAQTPVARTVRTVVTMRAAGTEELRAYAQTGEGLDKAGAYAIQGIGAFLVQSIDGSHSNVIGLPVCEVVQDLLGAGLLERFP